MRRMAPGARQTCEAWCAAVDVVACPPCKGLVFDAAVMADAIDVASDLLYYFSGRQFSGVCSDVVRPNDDGAAPWPHIGQQPVDFSRRHYNDNATDRNPDGLWEIVLPGYPIVAITQVKVDGVVLAPTAYRIIDDRWIARVDGSAWPVMQDLAKASTEKGTFEVAYTFGVPIPPMARRAAAAYACQIAKACTPGAADCSLPPRTQSVVRQGLTTRQLDPQDFIEKGRTGVLEADRFIKAVNPNGLQERAVVLSPDTNWPAHRIR